MVKKLSAASVLRSCITFLFDCDGVIWKSNDLFPSSVVLIKHLLDSKKNVFFITNNSRCSMEEYANKCIKLGLPITEHNIICTANITSEYIRDQKLGGKVYVIGEKGIGSELDKIGIHHFGIGPDNYSNVDNPIENIDLESDVSSVVVGYDAHFNYRKLLKAVSYINNGATFIATNEDAQLPTGKIVIPGTGSIVMSVKFASTKEPIVMGKPHKPIFDMLKSRCVFEPSKTIMIGDNLHTDISFGNKFGLFTGCVLTGVTCLDDIKHVTESTQSEHALLRPSFVFSSVAEIYDLLQSTE